MKIIDIAEKINIAGGTLYLVGGALRDELLNIKSDDEDYCVVGLNCETFEKLFPNAFKRGRDFPVYDIERKRICNGKKGEKVWGRT